MQATRPYGHPQHTYTYTRTKCRESGKITVQGNLIYMMHYLRDKAFYAIENFELIALAGEKEGKTEEKSKVIKV